MKQKKYIPTNDNIKIAIIGLGYVGLPLFCQLSKLYSCIGYDVDYNRINELSNGIDSRNNVKTEKICDAISYSIVTTDIRKIATCNILIVTVPTPINNYFVPDTSALENACLSISKILRPKTIVVFESTVYPGATEELCVPLLSKNSRLVFNKNFFVGYSPERINIGDDKHQISNVPKIISGSTPDVTNFLASIYQSVLEQPVVIASSIKVAEAAKMYENVQRDTLIALANEYADYCKKEGIDIEEVTNCASSKWNFSQVKPGLVGGHCIGVDPYYLLYRASHIGVDLPLVKQSRRTNEEKVKIVSERIARMINPHDNVLFLGFSYKPNCQDIRNTKVAFIAKKLIEKGYSIDCYDPLVNAADVFNEYGIKLIKKLPNELHYALIIVMVNHDCFKSIICHNRKENSKIVNLQRIL